MITHDGGQIYVTLTRKTGLTKLLRLLEAEAALGLHETANVTYKNRRGTYRKSMSVTELAELVRVEEDNRKNLLLEAALKVGV
ncbi:hypothetical protein [Streptomyces noursei]|uniref:hypothetical protein n=1 Tax=Streptomyces noursei TaxID=1971 RepID=UPI00167874B7|nr:hypothetical protein [Streptomyces noursei]MCZ1019424.1 hypothetical protein [Streptomyces noursei]GGX08308.1 hypothetical protein GCM10010341_32490 [Streptomyces noursei]